MLLIVNISLLNDGNISIVVDIFTPEKRSLVMSRVRDRDTKPERIVRCLVHGMGYRFRLRRRDLPGKPDIVLPRHRKIIFVHGCFWHGHKGCPAASRPKTNVEFWTSKLDQNEERDRENVRRLLKQGWNVLIVWECETADRDKLFDKLTTFLQEAPSKGRHG